MKIINAQQIEHNKWQDYVNHHEFGTIFHTPYMYEVYRTIPNNNPFALFVLNSDGAIQGMMSGILQTIKSGLTTKISTRAVIMQSPIYADLQTLDFLLRNYKEFVAKKAVYSEVRNHFNLFDIETKDIYEKNGFRFDEHLNVIIDLTLSEESLLAMIHPKRRNEIRKAIKNNVTVSELGLDHIPVVYSILKEVYGRARLPLLPYSFFNNAYARSSQGNGMVAYGAFYNNQLIGTMVTLQYKDTVYDMYAGSLLDYYNRNPNDLLPWEIFKICKAQGFARFDFGGAGKPNIPYGVREYKVKFGGQLVNLGRYQAIHNRGLYSIAESGFKLLQRIKGSL